MKSLSQIILSGVMLAVSLVPFIASAKDWTDPANQTNEPCVVNGVENFRSPMFVDTDATAEIMQLERDLCWMVAKKELDKLASYLDKDGLLFLDRGNILYGRDQQMALFTQLLQIEGLLFAWEPIEAHVSASNDMAWAFGLVKLQMPGEEMQVAKYTSIWEKTDGKWLNVSEMRNPFRR
ncbi:nuclear transport factor 2 family protein [Vibrio pacinii]|uniref:nuclear transport factor 2 family protein n=1 Tax=Vibrio pacinii TaxID=170674 RepID=UPI00056DFD34|nr:nuclear transport factor 2 family protein [Vibrio pacinii]